MSFLSLAFLILLLNPASPGFTPSNTPTVSPTRSVTSGLTPTATPTGSTSPTGTRSPTPTRTGTISIPATPSITPTPSTSPGMYPGHAISVIDTTGSFSPLQSGCTGSSGCGPTIASSGGGGGNTYGTSAFYITPHPVFDVLLTSITFPLQPNVCVSGGGCGGPSYYNSAFTADLYFTNSTSLLPTNLVVSANSVGLGAAANETIVTNTARYATLTLNSVSSNWVIPARSRLPPLATPTSLYVLVLRATAISGGRLYFNNLAAAPIANTGLLNLTYTYTSANPGFGAPVAGIAFNSVGVQVSGVVLALPTPTPTPTRSPTPTGTPTGTSSKGSSLSSTPTPSSSSTMSFSPTVTPSLTASPTPTPTLTPTSSAAAGLRAGQAIAVIDTTGNPSLSSPLLVTGCTGSTACGTALTTTSGGGGSTISYGYTAFYITPHPVFDVLLTSITFPLQPNVCTSGYGCGGNAYYTAAFTADLYYTTTSTLIPTTPVVLSNNLNQGKAANATVVANNARYVTLKLNSVSENWMIPAQPRLPSTALNTSLYVLVLRPTAISGGTLYFNKLATPPTVNTGALDFTYTSASSSSQIFTAPTPGLTFGGGVGVLVSGVTLALPSPTSTPTSSPTPTGTGTGTGTPSPSLSSSPSNTATGTRTPSMTTTLTATPSVTTTNTPTPSITASVSPTNLPLIVNNSVVGLSGGAVGGIAVGGIIFVGGLFTLFICTQTRIKKTPSKKAPFASSGGSGPVARRQGGLLGMLGLSGKGGVGGVGSSHKKGVKGGGGGMYGSRPPPGGGPSSSSSSFSAFENPTNHLSPPTSAMNPMLATFAGPGAAAMASIPLPFERSEGGGGVGGGEGDGVSLPMEEAGETFESPPSKWAVAMFDYAATQGDELGLLPEDRVWVSVGEEVEGWSRGRVCDVHGKFKEGVEGLFPTGFVRIMSEAQARAQGLALEGPKRVRLVKKMVEVEVEEEVREGEEGEEGVPPEESEDDTPLPEGWRKKGLKKGASKSGRKLVFYENTVTGAVSYKRPTEPAVKPKLALKKLDDEEEE